MNFVKGKMYICLKVLLLLTIVYSNIFIENVDSIKKKSFKGKETEKNAENNFDTEAENEDEQNPNPNTSHNTGKPIKGVIFGKQKENKCEKLKNNDVSKTSYPLDICSGQKYNGVWKYYATSEMCVFSDETPDCLIYDKTAYSFFPGSIYNIADYVLPPCTDGSNNWTIYAKCKHGEKQNYTCSGGIWVGSSSNNITNCESEDTWDEIFKEDHEYRIILENIEDENENEDNEQNPWTQSNSSINIIIKAEDKSSDGKKKENEKPDVKNENEEEKTIIDKIHVGEKESDNIDNINKNKDDNKDNKNNKQEMIDILNHTSRHSSCDIIGISFGILIAVVTIFV